MKNVEIKHKDEFISKVKEQENDSDFNKQNLKKEKETESNIEKYEMLTTNVLFSIMIALTTIGTGMIIVKLNEYLEPLRLKNTDYVFPSIFDFKITLIVLPIMCVRIFFLPFFFFKFMSVFNFYFFIFYW